MVLGNPPYNGFAGLPAEEEAGLVEPYRTTKKAPQPQGQGLNELYVRFFRVAERCITERHAKHGIVCYISTFLVAQPAFKYGDAGTLLGRIRSGLDRQLEWRQVQRLAN